MSIPFDDGLCEITDNTSERDEDSEDPRMDPLKQGETGDKMNEGHAEKGRDQNASKKSLPGFSGTDFWNHFVFTDQFADNVGSDIGEFSDRKKVENGHAGIKALGVHKIDQADVTKEDGDVEKSHDRSCLISNGIRRFGENEDVTTEDNEDHQSEKTEEIEGEE